MRRISGASASEGRSQVIRRLLRFQLVLVWAFAWALLSAAELPAGLSYQTRQLEGPVSIHLLVVDPEAHLIRLERANQAGLGREPVSSMASRRSAVAAINGGFFRRGGKYDGEPLGILKIGEVWYSTPDLPRGAIGWAEGGRRVLIDRLEMKWRLLLPEGELPVHGLNRERGMDTAIVYNPVFNRTTLTGNGGIEYLVTGGRVKEVRENSGSSEIPENGFVYSVGSRLRNSIPLVAVGTPVRLDWTFLAGEEGVGDDTRWAAMEYVVGGTPVLFCPGRDAGNFEAERLPADFTKERHPRTAVGIKAGGEWVFVVVDGRRPGVSIGMTVPELALLMRSLGCVQALNLDGGGSATLVINGRVVNQPSDLGGERPVSDALLVIERTTRPSGARP